MWEGIYREPLSLNAWNYAEGDPVNSTDPSGRCTGGVGATEIAEGLSSGLLNPLAWPKLYQGVSQAWQKCDENLKKAQQKYEQGNLPSAYAHGTGFLTSVEGGQGWIGGWNSDVEAVSHSRFTKMAQLAPATWWTGLRPEDLPDLLEYGKAECRIWSTGLTIASFITPGLMWVKGGLSASVEGVGRFGVPDEFVPVWSMDQEAAWANLSRLTSSASKALAIRPPSALGPWEQYPPNRGFLGGYKTVERATVDQVLSRVGNPTGRFVSPPGTTLSQRGLPSNYPDTTETLWKVIKEFDMDAGVASPWRDAEGLGIQYELPDTIENMLRDKLIGPVK